MARAKLEKFFNYFSRFIYAIAGITLMVAALLLLGKGFGNIYLPAARFKSGINVVQEGVGSILIAAAIYVVSWHLLKRETLGPGVPGLIDARQALKRFIAILALLVTFEVLILFIHAAYWHDPSALLEAAMLAGSGVIVLLGHCIYQGKKPGELR